MRSSCAWATCSWRSRSSSSRSSCWGSSSGPLGWHLILVLGLPGWIIYARVVRVRVLAERDKDYITAARSIGASGLRQLRRYVLPSVWQVVLVIALLDLGFVILVESTLSFLGFGLPQSTPSWGSILAEGRRNMLIAPWLRDHPRSRDRDHGPGRQPDRRRCGRRPGPQAQEGRLPRALRPARDRSSATTTSVAEPGCRETR